MTQHRSATKMQRVYDKAHRRSTNRAHAEEKYVEAVAVSNAIEGSQNAVDLAWLQFLLQRCAHDGARAKLVRSIEWLTANPNKGLSEAFRVTFARIERTMRMVEQGLTPTSTGARPLRGKPWPKPERPAWMSDPSQLPKRPPGKAPC